MEIREGQMLVGLVVGVHSTLSINSVGTTWSSTGQEHTSERSLTLTLFLL